MLLFKDYLKERLKKQLPGFQSQVNMAPQPLDKQRERYFQPRKDSRLSGVLVPLFPNEDNMLEIILTLRSDDINHGGQISFPGGGAVDSENAVEAALREANEEIDLQKEDVEIVGELSSLYVRRSNNLVHPVVGFLGHKPSLSPDPTEVEEVFTVKLNDLTADCNLRVEKWDLLNKTYEVPFWNIHRVPLWGATAMMLSELVELYRQYLKIISNGQK